MVMDDGLKDLYQRKADAMRRRPAFARGTGHASVQTTIGLACEVREGERVLPVDLPVEEGGTAAAPHPGQLMRASLGACLAIGYRIWGARLGVPIAAVAVEVTCEYDARGQMGVDPSVSVGWQRISFDVRITSDSAEAQVRGMVETANRLSPMLANLSRDIAQIHHLTVIHG